MLQMVQTKKVAHYHHNGGAMVACSDSLCSFNRRSYHGLRSLRRARHSWDLTHDLVCRNSDATSVTVLVMPSLIPYLKLSTLLSSSPSFY